MPSSCKSCQTAPARIRSGPEGEGSCCKLAGLAGAQQRARWGCAPAQETLGGGTTCGHSPQIGWPAGVAESMGDRGPGGCGSGGSGGASGSTDHALLPADVHTHHAARSACHLASQHCQQPLQPVAHQVLGHQDGVQCVRDLSHAKLEGRLLRVPLHGLVCSRDAVGVAQLLLRRMGPCCM